ncbi:hypothetical protein QVZ41_00130 [Wenyingzhuangia sp. chi5]|uniref:DKNYY family protein n=1 Tax=Wenyingzhuangia gilva TaxID=3057677 RepID=A0ABT8VMS0_9FLAO|nr:hypothetical protein [Wenyingzhuangia sp. chi5]MDO3693255.1 hypothetical protein [Wenyingzhuangia sp. chi5]
MKNTIIGILFFLCVHNIYAHREKTYYLQGKVGETELAIKIDEYGNDCVASYFTQNDLYNHLLEGVILENGQINLISKYWDPVKKQNITKDSVQLIEKEKNVWTGTWTYENKEKIAFSLKPIDIEKLNHPYFEAIKKYEVDPFTAYRTKDVKFKKGKKQKISKGACIRKMTDPVTGISFFRIINSRKYKIQADSINNKLIANHLKMINTKYSCVYLGSNGEYSIDYEVTFLNQDFISFTTNTNRSCFGIKGSNATEYHTFKLIDGIAPKLEDLFWFGEQPQPQLSSGEYKWMQYRYKVFGPKILEILTSLYPEKINPTEAIKCNYNSVKAWQFPIWKLTTKGLYLESKTLTNKKCDDTYWSIIPFENLKSFTNPNYNFTK